jgi:Na+/H+ antiporter NhaC
MIIIYVCIPLSYETGIMARLIFLFTLVSLLGSPTKGNMKDSHVQGQVDLSVKFPDLYIKHIKSTITFSIDDSLARKRFMNQKLPVVINGEKDTLNFSEGTATIEYVPLKKEKLTIFIQGKEFAGKVNPVPLWLSILPPLFAILVALIFKEVFSALFLGILLGTFIMYMYQGFNVFISFFKGLFAIIDTYVLQSLTDPGHVSIIVFSLLIGGMVNVITRNGGMKGIVNILSRYANTPRSGQFVTWLLGIAIFFDDYANTLVVGNTMRPVTDRLKISREKLAYLVDSTAAPIAAIAFVTTWIGAELSYIQNGINTLQIDESPYNVFINSLAYSFYPVFTLSFILILVYTRKDFGPMFRVEKKARLGTMPGKKETAESSFSYNIDDLKMVTGATPRWYNAGIPVIIVIFGTFAGLLYTGWDPAVWNNNELAFTTKLSEIIGNSDSYLALLWSSLLGLLGAVGLTLSQRIMHLKDTVESIIQGFKTMLTAIIILVLAWSLALITEHMHTADFISRSLIEFNISPYFVPTLTFILGALVAFSTGSSWGTMAILYPLILPASWMIAEKFNLDYESSLSIFHNVVASVLAGSVLGDHCSPISDTTILSSLASSCNHIDHVRTQLPYALTVGSVAILSGVLPAAFGVPSYILFPTGIVLMILIVKFTGKRVT